MVSNLTIPGADQRGLDRQKPFPDCNDIIYTQSSVNIGKYSNFEAEVFSFYHRVIAYGQKYHL